MLIVCSLSLWQCLVILFVLYLSFFLSLSISLSPFYLSISLSHSPSLFYHCCRFIGPILIAAHFPNLVCHFSEALSSRSILFSHYLIFSFSYSPFPIYIYLILSFFLYLSLSIPRIFLSSHCNIQYIYLYTLGRCLSVCLSLVSISKCATFFCTARRAQNQTAIYWFFFNCKNLVFNRSVMKVKFKLQKKY